MDNTILKLDGITKIFPNGTVANRNISISFNKGKFTLFVVRMALVNQL